MYGLKREIDLTFLQGRELIQVAIGMYQVIFNFDGDVSISIEGQFEHTSKVNSSEWRPGNPAMAVTTVNLLSAKVEAVHGQEDGTLKLTFSNGDRLVIRDASTEYESYQISRRGETIIV
jgi:hypothetical protein